MVESENEGERERERGTESESENEQKTHQRCFSPFNRNFLFSFSSVRSLKRELLFEGEKEKLLQVRSKPVLANFPQSFPPQITPCQRSLSGCYISRVALKENLIRQHLFAFYALSYQVAGREVGWGGEKSSFDYIFLFSPLGELTEQILKRLNKKIRIFFQRFKPGVVDGASSPSRLPLFDVKDTTHRSRIHEFFLPSWGTIQ